jgi:hypothetical protein
MKTAALTFLLVALVSCQFAPELRPIPGSITYRGQPRQKLVKSPIGSQLPHEFTDEWGRRVKETYILQPDRTLKLVERHYIEPPF